MQWKTTAFLQSVESGVMLGQVTQGSCGCLMISSVRSQAGWNNLIWWKVPLAMAVGLDWMISERSLPTQTIL